jgi:hypothetical protein
VVVAVHGGVLDQDLDDGRHGEQVADAVLLDRLPEGLGVQLLAGQQHGGAPRATFSSAWMPAPCDSGATAIEQSRSVVPGIRSARWLVTTKAICPCVSTPAFGRPVVPEV